MWGSISQIKFHDMTFYTWNFFLIQLLLICAASSHPKLSWERPKNIYKKSITALITITATRAIYQ